MNIREIANGINEKSKEYQLGKFQGLRKEIKGLSKRKSSIIFTNHTISEEGWAYHSGGSKELHFSIGLEQQGFRYGVTISLQINILLADLSILFPKTLKLNSLIRNELNLFMDYKMWYWREKRSKITEVHEINDSLAKNGTYIFIGK
jgi:hypothetical protein